MAEKFADLVAVVSADTTKLKSGLTSASTNISSFGSLGVASFAAVGVAAVAVGAAVGAAIEPLSLAYMV